jgi:lipopolysaccharide transport system ATP-binding protein
MGELAVRVEGLGKEYRLGGPRERYSTLRDRVNTLASAPFRALRGRGERSEQSPPFWALKDVSFEVRPGEVAGIIGRNGAGKSTLLKILSRITEPTEGEVDIDGRVGSLLEVGTGFHPELTGRENVYLNGAILGMKRAEIARKFDEIVAFAEVEKFIDTPVKHYSSGMYMRLAFAVAAHLEPEILIVDEVLAVGDAEFQQKCLGRMKDIARSGRTVLFVSHHLQSVAQLCTQVIILAGGSVTYEGDVAEGIRMYVRSLRRAERSTDEGANRRPGTGEARLVAVRPAKDAFTPDEEKVVQFSVRRSRPYGSRYYISGLLTDVNEITVAHVDSRLVGYWADDVPAWDGELVIRHPWLKAGDYRLDLFLCGNGIIDQFEFACQIRVLPANPYPAVTEAAAGTYGVVLPDFSFTPGAPGRTTASLS